MDVESAFAEARRRHQAGNLAEAEAAYRVAVALDRSLDALYELGVVLLHQGRFGDAVEIYREAAARWPGQANVQCALGAALENIGQADAALDHYRRAAMLEPQQRIALANGAGLLTRLGRHQEAEDWARRALALGEEPVVLHTLGLAIMKQGRLAEAAQSFERALALAPTYVEAQFNLASALRDQGQTDAAVVGFRGVVELAPGAATPAFALCMAHLPPLYRDEAEIDRRRRDYADALEALVARADEAGAESLADGVGMAQPFYLAYQGRDDIALQRRHGALVCRAMAARHPPIALTGPPRAGERIRVGIVSGFFRDHANWRLPVRGWVSGLDRAEFELFAYHSGALRDAATLEAERLCEHFVQGPLPFDAWRARIAADAPHVLIYPEIGMDMVAARLAALRLAPVQCNSWGHPTTSGYPTLDYYLGSDLMEPADGDRHYSERLVRLPGLSTIVDRGPAPKVEATREASGLPAHAIVYWCGQSLYKYLPQFDWLIPAIARGVPDSLFVFIEFADSPELTDRFRQRLESAFAAFGLDAGDHVRLLPRLTPQGFASALGQADLVLDSVGWSGCNSLFDALEHDLPIVTMPGALMRGRHGAAILQAIGVTETICPTLDDYVATAIALGRDAALRARIGAAVASGRRSMDRGAAAVDALAAHLREWAGQA